MSDFVTVATYLSATEAEVERLALETAGIAAIVDDEAVGTVLWQNLVGGVKIQVPAADAARAEQVLNEFRAAAQPANAGGDAADDGVSLNCPKCKAELWFASDRRGETETCPECGASIVVPT
jgi:ssDNA-binding Zn-finger/Zn-ribbon topoisomerase 1